MPNTTTRLTLQEPITADSPTELRLAVTNNSSTLDNAVLVTEGTLAGRPAANTVEKDHVYKATDTVEWFISDGTNWNTILVAAAWQTPTFQNSWVNFVPDGGQQTVKYRKVGDMIQLRGSCGNGTAGTIFTLPTGYRPAADVYGPGYGLATTVGDFFIASTGVVSTAGGTPTLVAFDGFEFYTS